MKLFKGKPTLQEIEKEFDIETYRLGQFVGQMARLETAKNKCLQRLDALTKQATATKAKIESQVNLKVQQGEKENEIH